MMCGLTYVEAEINRVMKRSRLLLVVLEVVTALQQVIKMKKKSKLESRQKNAFEVPQALKKTKNKKGGRE